MSIEGIVLAAGLSTRAGTHKMMLRIGGKTIIERCVMAMSVVCARIIVVGGYRFENLARVLSGKPKVELVLNESYREGMLSSLKNGIRYTRGQRIFIMPGDHPFVAENIYQSMLNVDEPIVIPTFHGKAGHPVLLSRQMACDLLFSRKYSSLREFLQDKGFAAIAANDNAIYRDIDTMEDYRQALHYWLRLAKGTIKG